MSACAGLGDSGRPRDELYVVLPGADHRPGGLTVSRRGHETVLADPYAALKVTASRHAEATALALGQIQEVFGAALAARPPRPVSFVLYFIEATDELTPESQDVARNLLAEIARRPAPEVVVIGHTDRVGAVESNDRLSMQRALRVRDELVRLGLAPDRITVEARGEREPAVPTGDEVPEPRNRRVELTAR